MFLHFALAREGEQLPHQLGRPMPLLLDDLDAVEHLGLVLHRALHQIQMPHHAGQHVVEIMRNAAGQRTHRLHALGVHHLPLQLRHVRNVAMQGGITHQHAALVAHRRQAAQGRIFGAIRPQAAVPAAPGLPLGHRPLGLAGRLVVLRPEIPHAPSARLVRLQPHIAAKRRIAEIDASVGIEGANRLRSLLHRVRQPAHLVLQFLAFGHIMQQPHPAGGVSGGVHDGGQIQLVPEWRAILAPVALQQTHRPLLAHRLTGAFPRQLIHILRRPQQTRMPAQHLVLRIAGDAGESGIDRNDGMIVVRGLRHHHPKRQVIHDRLKQCVLPAGLLQGSHHPKPDERRRQQAKRQRIGRADQPGIVMHPQRIQRQHDEQLDAHNGRQQPQADAPGCAPTLFAHDAHIPNYRRLAPAHQPKNTVNNLRKNLMPNLRE